MTKTEYMQVGCESCITVLCRFLCYRLCLTCMLRVRVCVCVRVRVLQTTEFEHGSMLMLPYGANG